MHLITLKNCIIYHESRLLLKHYAQISRFAWLQGLYSFIAVENERKLLENRKRVMKNTRLFKHFIREIKTHSFQKVNFS